MKKFLLSLLCVAACATSVMAETWTWQGNGFYRVENYKTTRIAYLMDRHAVVDKVATWVDFSAIELYYTHETALSDPASVLYIEKVGSLYNIKAQNCSVYDMVEVYMNLLAEGENGACLAYGTYSGMTKYMGDMDYSTKEMTYMVDNAVNAGRLWYTHPISETSSDNFFGFKPTVTADGNNYCVSYCSFAYTMPDGMEALYVTSIDNKRGLAVYDTMTGTVAGGAPVVIKCKGANVADNKVTLKSSGGTTPSGNKLKGAYFASNRANHVAYTAWDKSTMRELGITSEGKLGYISADYEMVPRNTSYLVVDADAPAELRLVSKAEYQSIIDAEIAIESVTLNADKCELEIGDTYQLKATIQPTNATWSEVTWTIGNNSVATISATGLVTAVAEGTTTVTATADGIKATVSVTVSKKAQSITWDQDFSTIYDNQSITLNATASSGLAASYQVVKGSSIASISGNVLTLTGDGEVSIKATQSGNSTYAEAASVTMTFNVLAGISSAAADSGFAVNGRELLNPQRQQMGVYSILGAAVYQGQAESITLNPGVYIVRTPTTAKKIVIR